MNAPRTLGIGPVRRPIAVIDRIFLANCCRCRTVSATMSNSFARLPPTSRWIDRP